MNKRLSVSLAIALGAALLLQSGLPPAAAKPADDRWEQDCTGNVKLSPATKARLDAVYHKIYMDYNELIETYAWAGALTKEQKAVRLKMLKNYINTFYKRNYRWCSEHEPDEWEEEWYNNDNSDRD